MPDYIVEIVEFGFSCTMIANAMLFIPQMIRLYQTKDSSNLSLLMFVGFNVIQLFAILHGYIKQDEKLMYGMLLSFCLCFMLNVLASYYRFKKV